MIHHILVAGLPPRFHDRFREKLGLLQRRYNRIRFVSAPLSAQQGTGYGSGYVRSLEARLAASVQASSGDQAVLIVYVDHGPSSSLVVEAFYPYGLLDRIAAPHGEALSFNRERETVNLLVSEVSLRYEAFRAVISSVQNEVVNRRNKTPLLLPVQNFGSAHLDTLLRRVSTSLTHLADPDRARGFIKQRVQEFEAAHPAVQMEDRRGQRALANDAGVIFKAPGKDLHAVDQSDDNSHRDTCRIGARVRTGHSFHPAFHYDCSYPRGYPREIPSCHGVFQRPGRTTHANISPNDFVRKAG